MLTERLFHSPHAGQRDTCWIPVFKKHPWNWFASSFYFFWWAIHQWYLNNTSVTLRITRLWEANHLLTVGWQPCPFQISSHHNRTQGMGIMALRVPYQDINPYSTPTERRTQRVIEARGENEGKLYLSYSYCNKNQTDIKLKKNKTWSYHDCMD